MTDIYQGDPLQIMTADGVDMNIKGGQPEMDQGLNNFVNISLFTREGWFGNIFLKDANQKVGSKYLATSEKPITITSLNDTRLAAEKALKSPVVGKVLSTVTNPRKDHLNTDIEIQPPGQDAQQIQLSQNGANWINQALKGF
jgi:phage gp46-like protein